VILSGKVCIIDVSTDEPTYLIRLREDNSRVTLICSLATRGRLLRGYLPGGSYSHLADKVREMLVRQPTLARVFGERFNAGAIC